MANTDELLIGAKEMAVYCRCTHQTIYNWIKGHGFPAFKLPKGEYATDKELIRRWLMGRPNRYWERVHGEKEAEDTSGTDNRAYREDEPGAVQGNPVGSAERSTNGS